MNSYLIDGIPFNLFRKLLHLSGLPKFVCPSISMMTMLAFETHNPKSCVDRHISTDSANRQNSAQFSDWVKPHRKPQHECSTRHSCHALSANACLCSAQLFFSRDGALATAPTSTKTGAGP